MITLARKKRELNIQENDMRVKNLFTQAVALLGKTIEGQITQSNHQVVKGLLNYGLQRVPTQIDIEKIDEDQTKVTISSRSDDWKGEGAEESINNLLEMFEVLRTNDTKAIHEILDKDRFKSVMGLTKKKYYLRWIILLLIAAAAGACVNFLFK